MNSIVEYLAYYAQKTPDNLCIADLTGSFNYAEIWIEVKICADILINEIGLNKGDIALVECTQDHRFLMIDFACELAGVVFVPFARKTGKVSVIRLLEETNATIILCNSDMVFGETKLLNIDVLEKKVKSFNTEFLNSEELDKLQFPKKNELAEILFTTGTTGKEKGIEITHEANIAVAENISYAVDMKSDNKEMIPLPLNHSHGLRCCYANILSGAAVVITDGVTRIADVLRMLKEFRVTAMDISPSAAFILEKLSKGKMNDYREQIRYVQIGTSTLKEKEKEFLKSTFPEARLYNTYGTTESGRACVLDFNHSDKPSNCIGQCTKNAVCKIIDCNGDEIINSSPENMGRLAFYGKMNMRGYFKQPELTKEVLVNDYIYTNDIGYIDKDGYVFLFGRAGDIINCGGINISPDEIEGAAMNTNIILECACIAVNDPVSGQAPKLFVVPKEPQLFDMDRFRLCLANMIEKEKLPKNIEIIDSVPRSENGKILRRMLG